MAYYSVENYVSGARIADRIARLAEIGGLPNGGMSRMPFTREDGLARELFASWASDLGLEVRVDGGGNVIGRRAGTDSGAPAVLAGSHLDTQPSGGRFDGIAGVAAALEAVEAMSAAGFVNRNPIEIVDWAGEEAVGRFNLSMVGSRAMIGTLTLADLAAPCRYTGVTLGAAMSELGIDVAALPAAERAPGSIKAVIEMHVEQGPLLERVGKRVGVVTDIAGASRVHCTFIGQQAHSGAMPMEGRHDALCAAAEVTLAVENAAKSRPSVVGTVGFLNHEPHAVAVVPGRAQMIIDVRSVDALARDAVVAEIEAAARRIAERRCIKLDCRVGWAFAPRQLPKEMIDTIAHACEDLDIAYQYMASGAGHDSMMLADRFPVGMLLVPSVGGISHAPEEFSRTEDLETGARVLCRTLCALSQ